MKIFKVSDQERIIFSVHSNIRILILIYNGRKIWRCRLSTFLEFLNAQLDQLQQNISMDWVVILHQNEDKWKIFAQSKNPKLKLLAIENIISNNQVWINKIGHSNRIRYKTLKENSEIKSSKVFGYSSNGGPNFILAGTNELSKDGRSQLKLFAESLAYYPLIPNELTLFELRKEIKEISSSSTDETNYDQFIDKVLQLLQDSLNVEEVVLTTFENTKKAPAVIKSKLLFANNNENTLELIKQISVDIGDTGNNIILPKPSEDKEYIVNISPFSTILGVPIHLWGEIIGTVVLLDRRSDRIFGEKEFKYLELIVPQIALIVKNKILENEVKEKNRAQQIVEDRLVQSAKLAAVGEMAAGVAHELNNPLTTVSGFSELLLESMEKDSPEYEDMTLIHKEAHRARAVVRRLLDFTRQDAILHLDADINEILSEVLALVHHLAKMNNVNISIALWNELPSLRLDKNQIQQVLLNLIHNAIQAMPTGGDLILETQLNLKDNENWVTIIIRDNGVGIKEKDLDKIFKPFFTTKVIGEGTGLGLSISYKIISDHGGYIDVDSKANVGTTFAVWLPVNNTVISELE